LQHVPARRAGAQAAGDQFVGCGQRGSVPLRPVLVFQPHELAVDAGAGRAPGIGHQQQRVQPPHLGFVGHQLA
jgi:hypothetical protein